MKSVSQQPDYSYIKPVAGYEIRQHHATKLYSLWIGIDQCILGDIPTERIAQAIGAKLVNYAGTLPERIAQARLFVGW